MQSSSSTLSEISIICPKYVLSRYNSENSVGSENTLDSNDTITPTNKLTKIQKDRLDELEFYEKHLSTIIQYEIYKSIKSYHNGK